MKIQGGKNADDRHYQRGNEAKCRSQRAPKGFPAVCEEIDEMRPHGGQQYAEDHLYIKYVWGSIRLLFSACYPEFILLLKDNP